MNRFVESYDPTASDSYQKHVVIDQESCVLEVLDTAGQEQYMGLGDEWIRDGEGFILVYSITCRDSFEGVTRFHRQILAAKEFQRSRLTFLGPPVPPLIPTLGDPPVPIMLVGNK